MSAHIVFILFFLALGACIGSFLNVVVWRLPRGESLTHPPSHCPKCNHLLAWKDNIPVFGWIFLRGRCRYCNVPISARYPVVEFITGALFAAYYVMFFILHVGPCAPIRDALPPDAFGRVVAVNRMPETIYTDWPIYLLCIFLLASLFAASLVDAELFIIPLQIPWLVAGVGIAVHTLVDHPRLAGALNVDPTGLGGPLAAGGGLGLGISLLLFLTGRLPVSFADGEPALEVFQQRESPAAGQPAPPTNEAEARPYTPSEIRREMRKEMLFLMPPLVLALGSIALAHYVPAVRSAWQSALQYHWLSGLLGAVLGALVGGLVVWLARILGTLAFGRVAMGLGDVHLMFGVGAVIGAGPATIAFFIAPFAALLIGLYMWVTRKQRELPYGPYLSLATAAVMLCYCPIADYLRPGMQGLAQLLRVTFGS